MKSIGNTLWRLTLNLGSKRPICRFLYPKARNFIRMFKPRFDCSLVITFRCNFYGSCKYCNLSDLGFPELYPKDMPREKLINFLLWFPPSTVGITGGEPFMAKDFKELVAEIPKKHTVGVVTNLSFDVDEFSGILGKFEWITASFHPYAVRLEDFLDKVKRVRSINPKIKINIVAYPPLVSKLNDYVKTFEKNGTLVHIDPYIDLTTSYTKEEKEHVKEFLISKRMLDYPFDEKPKLCDAGINYFVVVPNGDAYTCSNGMFWNHVRAILGENETNSEPYYLGNIFDGSFGLRKKWISCSIPCFGCDLDHTKRKEIAT